MKLVPIKTSRGEIFKFENLNTIDIVNSKQESPPSGTKIIVVDKMIFDHMLEVIIENFYDVSYEWMKNNYPNLRVYILNIYIL